MLFFDVVSVVVVVVVVAVVVVVVVTCAADITTQKVFEQQLAANAIERQLRAIYEPELRRAQFHADKWFAECEASKAQLQDALDKPQGREEEFIKLHEAQIAELQARAPPTFGAGDGALEDAKAENERLKSDLLDIDQDVANKQAEVEYWKKRAEEAGRDWPSRTQSERRSYRSSGRPDDDKEDAYSFSDRASKDRGSGRKCLFATRFLSPRREASPTPPTYEGSLFRSIWSSSKRSRSSSSTPPGTPFIFFALKKVLVPAVTTEKLHTAL